jgi:hypothetical protein
MRIYTHLRIVCSLRLYASPQRQGDEFRVFVTYLEIYNGSGMDLLTENFNSGALEDLPCVQRY